VNHATVDNTTVDHATVDNTTVDHATVDNTALNHATVDNTTVDHATVDNTMVNNINQNNPNNDKVQDDTSNDKARDNDNSRDGFPESLLHFPSLDVRPLRKPRMPSVKPKRWKGLAYHDMNNLEEDPDDVLVIGDNNNGNTNNKSKTVIKIEGTLDSGASTSVAPIEAVPHILIRESAGSRRGQHYVSAGNERILNVGEQVIPFKTSEGRKCTIR